MAYNYTIYDACQDLIFLLTLFGAFYILMLKLENKALRENRTVQCICCENRKGDYKPKNCTNCNCKYYR